MEDVPSVGTHSTKSANPEAANEVEPEWSGIVGIEFYSRL